MIARLRWLGVNLTVCGGWRKPEYWGESRVELINRTRIFLNLPRFAGQFTLLRFVLGACNKALIISEPLYNSAPFVAGEHYVAATYQEMPRVIRYYLEHEDERRRIAESGYHLTMNHCLASASIERLAGRIRLLAQARAK
ncbi:MAG: glycosyltransferase [Bryobacteraceae bacterium]